VGCDKSSQSQIKIFEVAKEKLITRAVDDTFESDINNDWKLLFDPKSFNK
jgi:hypothetical protein